MASTTVQPLPTSTTAPTTSPTIPHETPRPNPTQNPVTSNSHFPSSSTINTPNFPRNPPSSHTTSNTSGFNPKKRALDHVDLLQNSPYFKMRALVKELRPLFLEVLRAPDIQNCEAGRGIQERVKIMIDLCRQKTSENVPLVKSNNDTGSHDLASEKQGGHKSAMIKPTDQPPQRFPVGNNLEKQSHDSSRISGTYIVGGSAFGWNFITFHGTKPEYYGRTKEAFRAGK